MNFEETEDLYNVYRGILRNNRSFQPGKSTAVEYRMDCPEYADLLKKYPFEKIAGKGTDLQRAIRVLKYLSPKLTHSPWYDGHVDCNALALLDYSLDKPEQGINCLNKAKILEEVCLALGIYARRVRFLPYSPFDFDCHVVTEIYDRSQEKWCMLDPTTNGYLVDEQGTILSLLEARERMADTRFVTYCKVTSREKDLQNPAVIVDANHSNSGKQYLEQIRICKEVLHSCRHHAGIQHMVKGFMIESYLVDGNQKVGGGCYGQSITDPCLGWEKTERLIYDLADLL